MKFFILLVILFATKTESAFSFLQENTPKTRCTFPADMERQIVLFLDGESLFLLSKVNKYCRNLLLDDELWKFAACKELGVKKLPEDYKNSRTFLVGCYTYTFQKVRLTISSWTSPLLSDDGTTIVLPYWERLQSPQTIIRKPKKPDTLLKDCYANVISPDGSVIAGWSSDCHEREKCVAFRWTSSKGLEFLPADLHRRSIALKILPSQTTPGDFAITGTFCDETRNDATFEWEGDTVRITDYPASFIDSRLKNQSKDEFISVSAIPKGWKFWKNHATRRNITNNTEEYVEDILKEHNAIPDKLHLEGAHAISANGTIISGTIEENGLKSLWLATIPRSHREKLPVEKPRDSLCQRAQSVCVNFIDALLIRLLFNNMGYIPLPFG